MWEVGGGVQGKRKGEERRGIRIRGEGGIYKGEREVNRDKGREREIKIMGEKRLEIRGERETEKDSEGREGDRDKGRGGNRDKGRGRQR